MKKLLLMIAAITALVSCGSSQIEVGDYVVGNDHFCSNQAKLNINLEICHDHKGKVTSIDQYQTITDRLETCTIQVSSTKKEKALCRNLQQVSGE